MRFAVAVYRIGRAALVLLAAFGIMMYLIRTKPAPESVVQENKGALVDVLPLQSSDVNFTISGYGTVEPRHLSNVIAEVAGRIIEKSPSLDKGALFDKDEILYRIDPADYLVQVQQLEAQLAQLNAETEQLVMEQKNALDLQQLAERDVQLTQQEVDRVRHLVERRAASQEELERVQRTMVTASTMLQNTKNTLRLFPAREQLLQARTQVSSSSLEQAKLQLSRTEIRAPFRGRILEESAAVGEYVQPGKQLAQIWNVDVLDVRVNLNSEELQWLLEDSAPPAAREWLNGAFRIEGEPPAWVPRASVSTEQAGTSVTWEGFVRGFEGRADAQTRTVPVAIEIRDPAGQAAADQAQPLVPGTFCRVAVHAQKREEAFIVPRSALQMDDSIWIAAGDRLRKRFVRVIRTENQIAYILPADAEANPLPQNGRGGDDETEYSAGTRPLQEGDLVVVSQLSSPTDGMLIRVQQTTPALEMATATP